MTRHDTQSCSKISALIPSIPQDIDTLIRNTEFFFKYLPIKNIYVVGPESISETIQNTNDDRLIFMNENELVDIQRIRELYSSRTDKNPCRVGWYVQQFIKMQFARFTSDEYYLIWDSDTIPVRHVDFFNSEATPILDIRPVLIPSYYNTMINLLPCITIPYDKSFVTEHILVNSAYMRECLDEIEKNTLIAGKNFQEKVINAANAEDLPSMGFSEYETYAYFVLTKHSDNCVMRKWRSLRTIAKLFDSYINDEQIAWLAKEYYAVSIEKWQKTSLLSFLVKSRLFRKMFSPTILEKLVTFHSLIRKALRLFIPERYRPLVKRLLHMK